MKAMAKTVTNRSPFQSDPGTSGWRSREKRTRRLGADVAEEGGDLLDAHLLAAGGAEPARLVRRGRLRGAMTLAGTPQL
jgi:hypothetical protein